MNQVNSLKQKKKNLDLRWAITKAVREFFWSEEFQEVDSPTIVKYAGQEPYLDPMELKILDERKKDYPAFLHTSPEFTMKKLLASGYQKIFYLGKVFRNIESFGGSHNPEFTMIEWYRAGESMQKLMEDCEKIIAVCAKISGKRKPEVKKVHMRELWDEIGVNLDMHLTQKQMYELCKQKGYKAKENEPYEDLFYRIFLNEIENKFSDNTALIIHHYPAQMAALAKFSELDDRYAERFELYLGKNELANAFTELTDKDEQRKRFEEEAQKRELLGKKHIPVDEEFLKALENMPISAGIALGLDRLVQFFSGCQNINDVLVLPAREQFL